MDSELLMILDQIERDKGVDKEILIQAVESNFKIAEIPIPTRYFPEASEVGIIAGIKYGLGILGCLFFYLIKKIKNC